MHKLWPPAGGDPGLRLVRQLELTSPTPELATAGPFHHHETPINQQSPRLSAPAHNTTAHRTSLRTPQDAGHYSGNAEHRQPHRHRRAARPPLGSRSLRPLGKGHQEASAGCAPGTERWQERASIKQLCECVQPPATMRGNKHNVLTYTQFHSRKMKRTRPCGSLTTITSRE